MNSNIAHLAENCKRNLRQTGDRLFRQNGEGGGMSKLQKSFPQKKYPPNNIKTLRRELNISLEKLAELTGYSNQYLSRLENSERRLNQDNMAAIASAFGVAESMLLNKKQETRKAPLFYVGAGARYYPTSEPIDWIELSESAPPGRLVGFIVRGNSMEPSYEEGDIVFCEWQPDIIHPDAIGARSVVITQDDRCLVKRLYEGSKQGLFNLVSMNNHPPEFDVKLKAAARIKHSNYKK